MPPNYVNNAKNFDEVPGMGIILYLWLSVSVRVSVRTINALKGAFLMLCQDLFQRIGAQGQDDKYQ